MMPYSAPKPEIRRLKGLLDFSRPAVTRMRAAAPMAIHWPISLVWGKRSRPSPTIKTIQENWSNTALSGSLFLKFCTAPTISPANRCKAPRPIHRPITGRELLTGSNTDGQGEKPNQVLYIAPQNRVATPPPQRIQKILRAPGEGFITFTRMGINRAIISP